jgi:hypothetical protein
MTNSTPFPFPRPGAALIEEARAARQAAQRIEQEERVRAHICMMLSRLKARTQKPHKGLLIDPAWVILKSRASGSSLAG